MDFLRNRRRIVEKRERIRIVMAKIRLKNIYSFTAKTFRFGIYLPLSNLINVYFGKYMSEKTRLEIARKRHRIAERHIENIIDPTVWGLTAECKLVKPVNDKIWLLWLQGKDKMPAIPSLCLSSIRKYFKNREITILTEDNLSEYLKLPDYIQNHYKNGNITPTHLSDIIRMGVLSKYGGFWMDATMLFVSPLPDNYLQSSLFTLKDYPHGAFVSRYRWAGFFFYSNGSPLPTILYHAFLDYWKKENTIVDYFFIDYAIDIAYRKNEIVRNEIDAVPINNKHVHELSKILDRPFDSKKFSELTEGTHCFKLSWKMFNENQLNSGPDNFYNHLLRQLKSN